MKTKDRGPRPRVRRLAIGVAAAVLVLACTACSGPAKVATQKPKQAGMNMAGPQVDVNIPASVLNARPAPWNLSTPEAAVRSFLDWTTYAYRTTQSAAATPTMGSHEGVRIDSYVQANLEQKRILDQTLTSLKIGAVSVEATKTLVPTHETWSYTYRSVTKGNAVVAGPYTASYDVTYTVVRDKAGQWVVDHVAAKSLGVVK